MIGQFILVPLAAALLVLILNRWISKLAGILTGVTSLYLLGLAFYFIGQRPFNNIIISTRWLFLVLDGLSHLMLVIIYGITFLITLYCLGYLQKYRQVNYFYAQLLLLLAGLGGVVLSADLLVLFAFVEVTALSAYALVAFEGGRTNLEAAVKYYVIGEVASILIIIGLGILYSLTGTFNLAVISRLLASQPSLVKNLALAFFLVGFGTKAALVPFHAWLPPIQQHRHRSQQCSRA
jgi:multicomponent Na+:H+ antiporter subunit D